MSAIGVDGVTRREKYGLCDCSIQQQGRQDAALCDASGVRRLHGAFDAVTQRPGVANPHVLASGKPLVESTGRARHLLALRRRQQPVDRALVDWRLDRLLLLRLHRSRVGSTAVETFRRSWTPRGALNLLLTVVRCLEQRAAQLQTVQGHRSGRFLCPACSRLRRTSVCSIESVDSRLRRRRNCLLR